MSFVHHFRSIKGFLCAWLLLSSFHLSMTFFNRVQFFNANVLINYILIAYSGICLGCGELLCGCIKFVSN